MRFRISTPGGATRELSLVRRVTSVGRGPENDVVIEDGELPETAFALLANGPTHRLTARAPVLVNGRRCSEWGLCPGDVIRAGGTELVYLEERPTPAAVPSARDEASLAEPPPGPSSAAQRTSLASLEPSASGARPPPPTDDQLALLRRLTAFCDRLLRSPDVARLLEILLDEVIDLCRADKGFLVLVDGDELRVQVARNVDREPIDDAVHRVSDSIVAKVLATRQPLMLADALDDPEFSASASVVSLKLLSVLCVPLMVRGEIFGVLSLGNDRLVNRFDARALDTLTIYAAQASLLLQNALLLDALKVENSGLKARIEASHFGELIGACTGMRDVYRRVDRIAPTELTVLVTGETGTGKELIARELHRRSPRAAGPFVAVNCAAIPESLIESELFGHVRGAFTGAHTSKQGRFQAAHRGTLFLDEIGDMPPQLQVKLLRALQDRVVQRVGDHRPEPVDVRIVAATNRSLEEAVRTGSFREDLFFRLNVVPLHLPPLRERGDDVAVLARFFLAKFTQELGGRAQGFTPAALAALRAFDWPGNVRQLENCVKKAIVLADGPLLTPADLDLDADRLPAVVPLQQAKDEFQRRYINEVLERNGGNRTKTAKDLGVDPRTIFRHLERLDSEKREATATSESGRAPESD